jgi:hypothetical protein
MKKRIVFYKRRKENLDNHRIRDKKSIVILNNLKKKLKKKT